MTAVGYLASNQVVGGSSPSGRAKLIKHLRHLRKFESSNETAIFQQISEFHCGGIDQLETNGSSEDSHDF